MRTQRAVEMKVSQLLNERKISQYSLANKTGLTKQAIANIINEKI